MVLCYCSARNLFHPFSLNWYHLAKLDDNITTTILILIQSTFLVYISQFNLYSFLCVLSLHDFIISTGFCVPHQVKIINNNITSRISPVAFLKSHRSPTIIQDSILNHLESKVICSLALNCCYFKKCHINGII